MLLQLLAILPKPSRTFMLLVNIDIFCTFVKFFIQKMLKSKYQMRKYTKAEVIICNLQVYILIKSQNLKNPFQICDQYKKALKNKRSQEQDGLRCRKKPVKNKKTVLKNAKNTKLGKKHLQSSFVQNIFEYYTKIKFIPLIVPHQFTILEMGNTEELVLRSESIMSKIMIGKQDQVIEHLEGEKIDYDVPINQMGDTIGHYAAYRGLYRVLQYLLKKGDKFDTLNNRGLSAIDVALPTVREWIYKNITSETY